MAEEIILTIIALGVSVLGTLGAFYYSKTNLDILKKEFDVLSKGRSSKENLANASCAIRSVSNNVRNIYKDRSKAEDSGMYDIIQSIVSEFYNTKKDRIELIFSFCELYIMSGMDNRGLKRTSISSSQKMLEYISSPKRTYTYSSMLRGNDEMFRTLVNFGFNVKPDIIDNKWISLSSIIYNWVFLNKEIKKLEEYSSIIEVYNPMIIEKMKNILNEMVTLVVDNLLVVNGKSLNFDNINTSENIQDLLMEFFLRYSTYEELFENLVSNCNVLDGLQKEMFLKSIE